MKGKGKKIWKRNGKRSKQLATKKYVKTLLRKDIETKYFDRVVTYTDLDYTGAYFYLLTAVPQGTTDSDRIGDKITIRGMDIRFTIDMPTVNLGYSPVRIIILQYTVLNSIGAVSAASFISSSFLTTTNAPNAPLRHDMQPNYIVLYDRLFGIQDLDASNRSFKVRVPIKYAKKTIAFNSASTDATNHIYMIALTDQVSGASSTEMQFHSRLHYDDA